MEEKKKGGFIKAMWCGDQACEDKIKVDTAATSRCIPFDADQENLGVDMVSGKPAKYRVIIARAY